MKRAVFFLVTEDGLGVITGQASSVTVQLSIDGASLVTATNTPVEIGSGYYYVDITNDEMNISYCLLILITCTGAQSQSYYIDKDEAAKPGDAMTLTTAYDAAKTASQLTSSDIPTVASIQSGLATSADLATVDGVVDAIKTKTDNLPASPAATGDAMTLTADYNAAKTASQLTSSDIPTVASIQNGIASQSALDSLITIATAVKTKTDNLPASPAATGDAMTLTAGTITSIKSGIATESDLAKCYSSMCHWSMTGNTLTTYGSTGSILQKFDLTKDASGNITSIEEHEE